MKPTWNVISREGLKIYSLILDTLGLYARSIEDLQLLLDVFEVTDDEPPPSLPFSSSVWGSKFGIMRTPVWPRAGSGTVMAMATAEKLLKDQGADVRAIEFPEDLQELPQWHSIVLRGDGRPAFLSEYQTNKGKLARFIKDSVENSEKISRREHTRAFDNLAAARPRVDEILSKFDAVIVPSVVDEAPVGIENTGIAAFNGLWTVSDQFRFCPAYLLLPCSHADT